MTREPPVIALDLALTTGHAHGPADPAAWRTGTWRLENSHGIGAACAALADRLADAITVLHPHLVIFEAPLPPPKQTHASTARLLLGLCATVELVCYRREVECREAAVPTVRSRVVGSGRAKKDDVMVWARGIMGEAWRGGSDEADALALLVFAHDQRERQRKAAGA